ncbi:MAG: ribbon-helix-helix domain-containing protein [Eubacteriaceae bacterium]
MAKPNRKFEEEYNPGVVDQLIDSKIPNIEKKTETKNTVGVGKGRASNKSVTIYPDTHRNLKIYSAQTDIQIRDIVDAAIKEYLDKYNH